MSYSGRRDEISKRKRSLSPFMTRDARSLSRDRVISKSREYRREIHHNRKTSKNRDSKYEEKLRLSKEKSLEIFREEKRLQTPLSEQTPYLKEKERSSPRERSTKLDLKRSNLVYNVSRRKDFSDCPSPKHPEVERKHGREKKKCKESKQTSNPDKHIKKKQYRSESQHSSESSSNSDDASKRIRFSLEKLHQDKQKVKDERKKHRELIKALETPEEKRVRRLAKKEAKERKRKERMGWDEEYMGYTNADNPFGDANLLETFVWNKKLEKEGISNLSCLELQHRNLQKQEENRRELEKVKKRRLEREQERAAREDELQGLQREKEAAQFKEWEAQEDHFHLKQAKLRSKIRIQNGRAKPIDLLANYISAEDEDLTVEMHEPYTYLNGLSITDLEDLLEDIKVYMELEQGKNVDYWRDITIITDDELNKLRKLDRSSKGEGRDRRDGINPSVATEVGTIFKGKSHTQLIIIQQEIDNKIRNGEGDIGYWESLLQQLKAVMARVRLRDRHQENLRRKLFQLKQEQGVENTPLFPIISKGNDDLCDAMPPPPIKVEPDSTTPDIAPLPRSLPIPLRSQPDKEDESEPIITEESLLELSYEEYEAGGYTPKRLASNEIELGTILTDPEEDENRLYYARQQVMGTGCVEPLSSEERAFEREARKGMTDEEAMFSVEAPTDQRYLWSDKYRPRKPRYFNRVHTGFEWNKYNQTHYDMDNPPPKIVQGYKFNIFYPDLIDKTITPEYTLTPCEDNKDFAILRFHAGPPYEDIAFKIVNREWEYSYKRGFRCQFYNNIFQLWFHFKRYRYRR